VMFMVSATEDCPSAHTPTAKSPSAVDVMVFDAAFFVK
jgi:hypothetical protein